MKFRNKAGRQYISILDETEYDDERNKGFCRFRKNRIRTS